MRPPQAPDNEAERQAALDRYLVLDTGNEAAFDALARLAGFVMQTPIALISLIDADRQWFKARYGLSDTMIPRVHSFCGHVVEAGNVVVVNDARADARFADNPYVIGEPRITFYVGTPLRTPDGFVLGALCAIDSVPRDVSPQAIEMLGLLAQQVMHLLEKRRLRLQLATEYAEAFVDKTRLEAVFDVMAEGVVLQGPSGEISKNNASASRILGLTDEQMRGRTSVDPRWRTIREDGSDFPGNEHPAMVALRTAQRVDHVVMGVEKPDGHLTWISINSMPLRHSSDAVEEVVTTFHDITPLKLAAERLSLQERLATTGTLVAGVGHEINNPLAFLMGNLDLAIDELRAIAGPSPSARLDDLLSVLGEARVGADRIRKIVRGLRALSREDVVLQAVPLDAVVETSISLALHELRRKATVHVELPDLPPALGDESRLTQVLVNLLVNAAQAFEQAEPDRNTVLIRGARRPDGRLRVSVIDNGPGIPAGIASRIFDPFFTTKEVGKGTGLGLAVSRGIITAVGGELSLESRVGEGATFHIDLAAAEFDAHDDARPDAAAGAARARILLLDDDLSVLSTMRRVLQREHDVTAVSDPREALTLLLQPIDLDIVFCDMMMPHLTGQELYQRVLAEKPELARKFVFVTGGATSPATKQFLDSVPNDLLEKPFSMATLLGLARRYVLRR